MRSKRIGAATVAVLTGTTALAIGVSTPALADADKSLGIRNVGDVLVDKAHQRIFISDEIGNKVVAVDYEGNELGSAPVASARNLALAADSSQVYVTSWSGKAIFALDTTTLAQTAKYTPGFPVRDVAVAGGRVWFSYEESADHGDLGTVDPSADPAAMVLDRFDTGNSVAQLASASAAPNRLGVVATSESAIADVSGDAITVVGSAQTNNAYADVALSANGDRLAVAGLHEAIEVRDVDDMSAAREIALWGGATDALDFAADGTIAVGLLRAYTSSPNGYVLTAAGETAKEIQLPVLGDVRPKALAWEPGGDRLFAVSSNDGTTYSLSVLTDSKRSQTEVTLAALPPAVPGAAVTISGKIASTVSFPAGATVSVSRAGTELGTAPVAVDGTFSLTDTPTALGTTAYQVTYAGDDFHLPATASASVQVAKVSSALTVTGPSSALPGAAFTITGRLTSSVSLPTGTTVAVTRGGEPAGTATVGADGTFAFTDTRAAAGTVAYGFAYAGDDIHLASSANASVEVTRGAATISLVGPTTATRAKPLTFTGKLASEVTLPAGRSLTITRTDLDSPAGKALGTKTLGTDGTFSFTDIPPAGGTVTYAFTYAGDDAHSPVTATRTVAVSRVTPAVTLNNNGKVYGYNATVAFTAHLGATYKNRTVEIWADPAGTDQARRLVKRATVNSAGNVVGYVKLTRDTTLSAVFTGDSQYAPRTVTVKVGTTVSLSLKLSKYYKTAKIGSTSYRYYHAKSQAQFSTSMTSGGSRKVYVQVQIYSKGKWKNLDTNYFKATDLLYISGSGLTGNKLRVRTAYVRGTSGDSLNTTTWTAYQYFTYTK